LNRKVVRYVITEASSSRVKGKVKIEGLNGDETVSEFDWRFRVHPTMPHQRKTGFLLKAPQFDGSQVKDSRAKIGTLAVANVLWPKAPTERVYNQPFVPTCLQQRFLYFQIRAAEETAVKQFR
jgi:hypothetical protein